MPESKFPTGPHTFKPGQLFEDEVPMEATLANGEKVTVLHREGGTLYSIPGRAANFGGVGDTVMPHTCHFNLPLKDGRHMQLFVNTDSGLLVAEIFGKNGKTGWELVREEFPLIVSSRAEKPLGARKFSLKPCEEAQG